MKLRMAKTSAAWIIVILLVLVGVGYLYMNGNLKFSMAPTSGEEKTSTGQVPLELPLKVLIVNKLNGSTITNVNVRVIKNGRDYEPLSLDSASNAYISTLEYKSGEKIDLSISFSNGAFFIVPITLPYYERDIAEIKAPEFHKMVVKIPVPPSALTIRLLDASGNSVASGSTVNLTTLGVDTLKYSLMVVNEERDTALFPSFHDPLTDRNYDSIVLVQLEGKAVIVDWDIAYTSGPTTKAYYTMLPDLAALYDPKTGTVTPGVFTKSMTVDCTAMNKGDTSTLTINAYIDASIEYIKGYQTVNTQAVSLAGFTLTIVK